jgi:hypothetical protein
MSIQLSNGGCGVLGQRQAPPPRILSGSARAYFSAHFIDTFCAHKAPAATPLADPLENASRAFLRARLPQIF